MTPHPRERTNGGRGWLETEVQLSSVSLLLNVFFSPLGQTGKVPGNIQVLRTNIGTGAAVDTGIGSVLGGIKFVRCPDRRKVAKHVGIVQKTDEARDR